MTSKRTSILSAAFCVLTLLGLQAASAADSKLSFRLIEKGSIVEVDVPKGAEALVWQSRDPSTQAWKEFSILPVAGPIEKLRLSAPQVPARKSDWRLFARTSGASQSPAQSFPGSFFQGTRVFPGIDLDAYDKESVPQPSAYSVYDFASLPFYSGYLEVPIRRFGNFLLSYHPQRGIILTDVSDPSKPTRKLDYSGLPPSDTISRREFVAVPGGSPSKLRFLVVDSISNAGLSSQGTTVYPLVADLQSGEVESLAPVVLAGDYRGAVAVPDAVLVLASKFDSAQSVLLDFRTSDNPIRTVTDYAERKRLVDFGGGLAALVGDMLNPSKVSIIKLVGGGTEALCEFTTASDLGEISVVGDIVTAYSRSGIAGFLETFKLPPAQQSAPIQRSTVLSIPSNLSSTTLSGRHFICKTFDSDLWTISTAGDTGEIQKSQFTTDANEVLLELRVVDDSVVAFSRKEDRSYALLYNIDSQDTLLPKQRILISQVFQKGYSRPYSFKIPDSDMIGVLGVDGQTQLFRVTGTGEGSQLFAGGSIPPSYSICGDGSLRGSRFFSVKSGLLSEFSINDRAEIARLSDLRITWNSDELSAAPGHILHLDKAISKIIVTDDQDPSVPLGETQIGEGRILHFSIKDEKLYVLRLRNHLTDTRRVLGRSETWPETFDRAQPPLYSWDVYDTSNLPNLALLDSLDVSLDVSPEMLNLLQRGEVEASVAWPREGVAAILVNHKTWISSSGDLLPSSLRPPANDDLPASTGFGLKRSQINRLLKDPFQTSITLGAGGKQYQRPYVGGGTSGGVVIIAFPQGPPPLKASQRRSCPILFIVDHRGPSPDVSEPILLGDQRTLRTSSLFSTDGAVAVGFESFEQRTVVSGKFARVREPWSKDLVRSYLQVVDIGGDAKALPRKAIDIPGMLQSISEFSPCSGILWTRSKGEYGWDYQACSFAGADAFLLSVVYNKFYDSFAALGRRGFLISEKSEVQQMQLVDDGSLTLSRLNIPNGLVLGFRVVDERAFAWVRDSLEASQPRTLQEFTTSSIPNPDMSWRLDRDLDRISWPVSGDGLLAVPNGVRGVEMLADE